MPFTLPPKLFQGIFLWHYTHQFCSSLVKGTVLLYQVYLTPCYEQDSWLPFSSKIDLYVMADWSDSTVQYILPLWLPEEYVVIYWFFYIPSSVSCSSCASDLLIPHIFFVFPLDQFIEVGGIASYEWTRKQQRKFQIVYSNSVYVLLCFIVSSSLAPYDHWACLLPSCTAIDIIISSFSVCTAWQLTFISR